MHLFVVVCCAYKTQYIITIASHILVTRYSIYFPLTHIRVKVTEEMSCPVYYKPSFITSMLSCTHYTLLFTHTCLFCMALPRKPSCRSVCITKPQLHPNTTTNYITHPSCVAMQHKKQPCEEDTAFPLGDLMPCVELSSKLTYTGSWALPGKSGQ